MVKPWRSIAVVAIWFGLALASAAQASVALASRGSPAPFGDLLLDACIDWGTCAVFTPYVCLHLATSEHIMRETLKSLEARLDPAGFVRIHRSVIVNVDRISHLEPIEHGEYLVTMRDGRSLYATRSFSRRLRP